MKLFYFLFTLTIASTAGAFVIMTDGYRLADPKNTVVNYNSASCTAVGISDADVRGSIEQSIAQYWNTVTESELRLTMGGPVDRNSLAQANAGEILVTCGNAGAGNAGVTNNDPDRGTSFIVMSSLLAGDTPEFMGVLTHELGHSIGLLHSDDSASVMTYNDHGWGPKPNFLAQDDKDGVTYLYPTEGKLGGLIPGCTVEARAGSTDPRGLLGELTFWLALVGFIYLRIRRKNRSQQPSKP